MKVSGFNGWSALVLALLTLSWTPAASGDEPLAPNQGAAAPGIQVSRDPSNRLLLTDSLVKDLSCAKLTPDNVLTFASPDAFSADRHNESPNWARSDGIANCWAMSSLQRRLFYLVRYGVQGAKVDATTWLDMARGKDEMHVFPYEGKRFGLNLILDLITDGDGSKNRTLETEINAQQNDHFFRLSNLELVMGSGTRSAEDNADSLKEIKKDLAAGRMPLLVLRMDRTYQHVVAVKRIEENATKRGDTRLTIYDSNYFREDQAIYFRNGYFHKCSDIEDELVKDCTIGVFIVDEPEMDEIQKVNYQYYSGLCRNLEGSHR